jgi:mycofactocin precursor
VPASDAVKEPEDAMTLPSTVDTAERDEVVTVIEAEPEDVDEVEDLIEDISIDGMCGVY